MNKVICSHRKKASQVYEFSYIDILKQVCDQEFKCL